MIPLTDLRAKAEAATKGQWYAHNPDDWMAMNVFCVTDSPDEPETQMSDDFDEDIIAMTLYQATRIAAHRSKKWAFNAEFIAAANPSVVLSLLDEITQLRSSLEAAEAAGARWQKCAEMYAEWCVKNGHSVTTEDFIASLESGTPCLSEADKEKAYLTSELARLREELEAHQWVSVKDRLPDCVYVIMANVDKHWRDAGVYQGEGHFVDKYSADAHPTHWMPLPELPLSPRGET